MDPSEDYEDYYSNHTGYDDGSVDGRNINKSCFKEVSCAVLLVVNVVIVLLGVGGNAVVIWIAGFKMKKTVNITWYLSLAISDLIFCVCLPFNIIQMTSDDWILGVFVCKFTSFVFLLNMFSSIFLLVVISVDRCVTVVFPVWAQNNRTLGRACMTVVLAWSLSVALSIPSLVFRAIDISHITGLAKCINKYPFPNSQTAVAVSRLVNGFVLPMIIISLCYAVIIFTLRTKRMARSSKPFKVMSALIVIFFFSWLPYHVFILLEISSLHDLANGQKISITIASANSCLNPFLYAFMGTDFKQKCRSFFSTIESAFDEGRSETSRRTSISDTGRRASISRHSTSV